MKNYPQHAGASVQNKNKTGSDGDSAAAPFLQGVKVKDEGKLLMDVTQAIFPEGWTMSNRNAVADGIRIVLSAIEAAPSPRAQALEEAAKLCDLSADASQDQLNKEQYPVVRDALRGEVVAARVLANSIRALSSQPVADHVADAGKVEGDGQSDLRGMKIALEQAWESNRERQNEIIRLKDALCNFTDGRDISYVEALEIARSLTGVQ